MTVNQNQHRCMITALSLAWQMGWADEAFQEGGQEAYDAVNKLPPSQQEAAYNAIKDKGLDV